MYFRKHQGYSALVWLLKYQSAQMSISVYFLCVFLPLLTYWVSLKQKHRVEEQVDLRTKLWHSLLRLIAGDTYQIPTHHQQSVTEGFAESLATPLNTQATEGGVKCLRIPFVTIISTIRYLLEHLLQGPWFIYWDDVPVLKNLDAMQQLERYEFWHDTDRLVLWSHRLLTMRSSRQRQRNRSVCACVQGMWPATKGHGRGPETSY